MKKQSFTVKKNCCILLVIVMAMIFSNVNHNDNVNITKTINNDIFNNDSLYKNSQTTLITQAKQYLASYSGTQSSNLTLKDGDTIGTTTIPTDTDITWTLTSNGSTSEDNINITGRINIKGKLTIKVNESSFSETEKNYYFRVQNGEYSQIFYVYEGGELIIQGSENHKIILSGRAGYNSTSNGYQGNESRIENVTATSGRPTITSSAIRNNGKLNINYFILENINAESSTAGGGIYLNSSDDTVINNTIIKWIKAQTGVAIYLPSGSIGDLTITNSTIQQCASNDNELGGTVKTIGTSASNITIENTVFKYNYSSGHGGAVYWNASNRNDTSENKKQPMLTIKDSDFIGNYAVDRGGALMIESNAVLEGDCSIDSNTGKHGGGIIISGYGGAASQATTSSDFTIQIGSGIKMTNNTAEYGGGLGFIMDEKMTLGVGSSISLVLDGAEISNNTATQLGGSIWFSNESLESNQYITNLKMNSGNILNNTSTSHGGGFYLKNVDFIMEDGLISENTSGADGGGIYVDNANLTLNGGSITSNKATGTGGGFYISSDNSTTTTVNMKNGIISANSASNGGAFGISGSNSTTTITGIEISENSATNGGAIYLINNTRLNMQSGNITSNSATNGGGFYVNSSNFNLNGGTISQNTATENGGGFYINDNSVVELNDGTITNNTATNGGGFYQTQASNTTTTTISGNCNVNQNIAQNGNGGGIYIDGGSIFNVVGGKIAHNNSNINDNTLTPVSGTLAKESTVGVGGGVYLLKGTFSMANSNNSAGIYGNTADYAADDLFASGDDTLFDAIPVLDMALDDEYADSDTWFEDYPKDETHLSLNNDNRVEIASNGRYREISNYDLLQYATSVLSASEDYICITMGIGIGDLILNINDNQVALDHTFIYELESLKDPTFKIQFTVNKGKSTKIVDIPAGTYNLKLISDWSWRYANTLNSEITENGTTRTTQGTNPISVKIYSYKTTGVVSSYVLNQKQWLSRTFVRPYPLNLSYQLQKEVVS